ncbi:hypothetical protein [Amycolatopsis nigrescens]|uniref:hypothetical protein n=1 Tax=Amycolatopsis nigrescens TaxID=381445 RepID=UPI0004776C29|nr:hypothetical protein [Amycolatopsis nigrescens]
MTSTATRPGGPGVGHGPEPGVPAREPRSGVAGLLDLPGQAVRGVMDFARTTPGRLSVIAVGLALLALITGLVGTFEVQGKKNTINELIDHREPLAAAAQQVYRSLSDADATAASGFLSTGTEPPELRKRYDTDIAQAGAALAKAASDSAGVSDAATKVGVLGQQLPVYTGLVETARANNRQGFPAGASYLREASELMRAKILPAAQDLYRIDTDRLAEEQDDATDFPWLTTLLVLGLVAALVGTQLHLTRKTNRLLNVGLVVASGAIALTIVWSAVALVVQSVLVNAGQTAGTQQVDVLVRARIAALQARADETLTLVARGDGAGYEKDFVDLAVQLIGPDGKGGLLNEAKASAEGLDSAGHVDSAMRNTITWFQAHQEVRKRDDSGDYDGAVKLAIDTGAKDSAASAFLSLDHDLVEAINVGRQEFLDETRNAERALILLAPGFAVLCVVAAAGVTMGIRERLREYR